MKQNQKTVLLLTFLFILCCVLSGCSKGAEVIIDENKAQAESSELKDKDTIYDLNDSDFGTEIDEVRVILPKLEVRCNELDYTSRQFEQTTYGTNAVIVNSRVNPDWKDGVVSLFKPDCADELVAYTSYITYPELRAYDFSALAFGDDIVLYGELVRGEMDKIAILKGDIADPFIVDLSEEHTGREIRIWEIQNGYLLLDIRKNIEGYDLYVGTMSFVENEKYLPVAVKECLGIDAGLSNSTSSSDSESVQSSNAGIENDVNEYNNLSENSENREYAIRKAAEFLSSGVGSHPDACCGSSIEIREEIPDDDNDYAHYSIAGRGFTGFYDSDCIECSLETSTFYFKTDYWFYKIVCDKDISIYYGSSKEDCNELCGLVIMDQIEEVYD